jgi:hypothetical protein
LLGAGKYDNLTELSSMPRRTTPVSEKLQAVLDDHDTLIGAQMCFKVEETVVLDHPGPISSPADRRS